MTFKEAHKQLLEWADGRYCSLYFELSCNCAREADETNCRVYIDPSISGEGNTWQEAFGELRVKLDGYTAPPAEELPDVSDERNDTDGK